MDRARAFAVKFHVLQAALLATANNA